MMSIAETQLLQDLKRRVEALEAQRQETQGAEQATTLRQYNAERRANRVGRRVEITRILTAHPDFTAKEVGKELERSGLNPLPAERTLRLDLQVIRGNERHSGGRDLRSPGF